MKVLHVIHSSRGGGAETQLDLLCRHGGSHGIDSVTFCVASGAELNEDVRRYITYRRKRKFDVGILGALRDAIAQSKPDIVHAWLPPVMTVPAMMAAWRTGIPAVASYRNTQAFRTLQDVIEFGAVALFGSGLVSNTPYEVCSAAHRWLFLRKHGVVIPNAVNVESKRDLPEASAFRGADSFNILFAGRLAEQKNVPALVGAMASTARGEGWRMNICGTGPLEQDLRGMATQAGVAGDLHWYGYRDDLPGVMRLHDVLVLPSWYEGFPNVMLEAMAVGLPVVASDTPVHRGVVGDSGAALLFDPRDHDQLARCLSRVQADAATRTAMTDAGRRLASTYGVERLVSRYREYYASVLSDASAPSDSIAR
ncbi:glycosyltransferase family 4 protein [Thiocystis violacea]|uniref:glycosyltransferase family 4 protein n=1 Tax=Thiocystis violacea TaxID=13725 RepID=UPI0019030721|nr:glycosyltransferase family 4 protein [Thiocystis violacea]MBK1725027.1 hypothetical protein [Thiocystis violacea]